MPKVDIVYSYLQPKHHNRPGLLTEGVSGIVFAGTGAGLLSAGEREALKPLLSLPAATRPVLVRSSRTGSGRVVAREDDDSLGMVPADNLNPQKARILLMLALTKTRDIDDIKRMFGEY